MIFYFIRHAQSTNNKLYESSGSIVGRHADPPLTEPGREQAQRLAHHLAQPYTSSDYDPHNFNGFGLTHLYCSLMVRAIETGLPIAKTTGLPLVAWPEIHERGGIFNPNPDTGEWEGLPGHNRAYFEEHFPELTLPDNLGRQGWWNRPVETGEQMAKRAQHVIRELKNRHGNTDDHVAIVSHGAFFDALYGNLMKTRFTHPSIEANSYIWFTVNNTSISRINFKDDYINLIYVNRVAHLPPHLITK